MTAPPDPLVLDALLRFSTRLAGLQRPEQIGQELARALQETFRPQILCLGLFDLEANRLRVLHQSPESLPDLGPVLDRAMRHGTRLSDRREEILPPDFTAWPGFPPTWLAVPLEARGIVTGVMLLGGEAGQFADADLKLAQVLAGIAAIALEANRLIDQAESARRSWAETVDAISPGICLIDDRGRVVRANRSFAELVGSQASEVIGRPWLALIPPAWNAGIESALDQAGTGHEEDLHSDDRAYAVTAFTTGPDRRFRVLVFLDRTERRRLQEQLIQSEKMSAVGQLVAGVAHDLNNPLASVLGFADFLVESSEVPQGLREPLRVIQQESLRAATIVKNLLSFARKQEHRRTATRLKPLLESTLVLLRNQLMADHVEVTLTVDPDIPELVVNANQIQQVFVNLVNNASQAIATSGQGTTIRIHARREPDMVVVDVADDGPGMTPEVAAQVFEPFFTTKGEGQGTGLGLNICQGIIREHGGRIVLETAPGSGSTFSVLLPIGEAETREPESAHLPEAAAPSGLRVLLVDDEPHILHYLRTTLETWGHSVETAQDGESGLMKAVEGRFDLILSDLRMPRLGGQEFYEQLSSKNPAMARQVVFSTGDTLRGDTLQFLEREGRPYLNKPFSLAELRGLLARITPASRQPPPG